MYLLTLQLGAAYTVVLVCYTLLIRSSCSTHHEQTTATT